MSCIACVCTYMGKRDKRKCALIVFAKSGVSRQSDNENRSSFKILFKIGLE